MTGWHRGFLRLWVAVSVLWMLVAVVFWNATGAVWFSGTLWHITVFGPPAILLLLGYVAIWIILGFGDDAT